MPRVIYEREKTVDEPESGLSVLEISRRHGIAHASACGGNARCSTCRVLVSSGGNLLTAPTEAEQRLARTKGFEANIRLACQARVLAPVTLRRLVWDDHDLELALVDTPQTTGREATLAILFSDIRDFTPFAERNLAYDVVHILNRYFHDMGGAVLSNHGYIDKYIGDGLMALFGLDRDDPALACRQATRAALEMLRALPELNRYLQHHFGVTLSIGVGIHVGSVIVAEIGHPKRMQLTAIGDAVNVASRVESATKQVGTPLLVTSEVADLLGTSFRLGQHFHTQLKGTSGERELVEVLASALSAPSLSLAQRSLQLRRELQKRMARADCPGFLRLAFHDAIAFDSLTGRGGADGSVHFAEEISLPCHRGLERAVRQLTEWKPDLNVGWADLIALAGAAAVRKCRGPDIPVPLGRTDATIPDLVDRLPVDAQPFTLQRQYFTDRGFSARDYVALMGCHTLGKAHGVPFTEDLLTFSNSYFRRLLQGGPTDGLAVLAADRALVDDPETHGIVVEYAGDEELFFRDFVAAYVKLSLLGTALQALS